MSTGLKANSDGSAAIQVGGTDVITLTSGGAATFVTSPTTVQAGTAAAPSITFSGDTNTGIYSPGADQVAIATGGSQRTVVDASGTLNTNVGGVEGIQIATDLNNSAISSRLLFTTSTNTIALFNASGELYFNTGTVKGSSSGTTRVVLNSNGIGLGGTSANSGTGIRFPATQDPSSNANTLDDYEEGTFAAFLSDGTNNTSTGAGSYVKVGKAVSVQIQIYNATYSGLTAGSLLRLSGLPFPVNDTCNAPISFPLSTYQCLMTQNSFSGTTSLGLYTTGSTPVDWVSATRTRIGGTSISMYASFVYYT